MLASPCTRRSARNRSPNAATTQGPCALPGSCGARGRSQRAPQQPLRAGSAGPSATVWPARCERTRSKAVQVAAGTDALPCQHSAVGDPDDGDVGASGCVRVGSRWRRAAQRASGCYSSLHAPVPARPWLDSCLSHGRAARPGSQPVPHSLGWAFSPSSSLCSVRHSPPASSPSKHVRVLIATPLGPSLTLSHAFSLSVSLSLRVTLSLPTRTERPCGAASTALTAPRNPRAASVAAMLTGIAAIVLARTTVSATARAS